MAYSYPRLNNGFNICLAATGGNLKFGVIGSRKRQNLWP